MKDQTLAIHAGFKSDPSTKSVTVPVYQTVAYEFDDAQRGGNRLAAAQLGAMLARGAEGVAKDVAVKLRANEVNFKLVGHNPFWLDVRAISGDEENTFLHYRLA